MITQEFKNKCSLAFRTDTRCLLLLDYLDRNYINEARQVIEFCIADLIVSICEPLSIGDEFIHNAKVKTLGEMRECEIVIMEELERRVHATQEQRV